MTVSRITPSTAPSSQTRPPEAHTRPAQEQPASRALVPLEQPIRKFVSRPRLDATFVAHLIAMAEQAPQTRPLRRATSDDARAVYDRATQRTATRYGEVLSQTA